MRYRTVEEAEYAQKKYNRSMLGGRPLDIYFIESKRDKLNRKRNMAPSTSPSETLFLGNVDYGATESDLENIFAEFHPVGVYIARDTSGKPLGSAQIEFRSVEDAQRAMEASTEKELFGKLLQVQFAMQQPRYPPRNTLFVANMHWNVTIEELEDVFAEFDPVAFIRRGDAQGRPYPYAYVNFRSTEEAQLAQEACDKKELLGRPLVVRFAAPVAEVSGPGQRSLDANHDNDIQMRTTAGQNITTNYEVRVVNMPPNASVRAITEFFATCGTVLSVVKATNELGEFSGRVRVKLGDSVGEQAALALDGSFFQGERIRITPLSSSLPTTTLFVRRLADSVTAEDLWNVFVLPKPLGVYRRQGRSCGFAHVRYWVVPRSATDSRSAKFPSHASTPRPFS